MEAPVAIGGHGGGLPLQGQVGRKEWRAVTESNGRERVVGDGSGNHARVGAAGRQRPNPGASRRSSRNGQMFHAGGSGHSSDSDHHGGDVGGAHLMGGSVSSQELIPQNVGQGDETVLYEEMHRAQQRNEHFESTLSSMSVDSGMNSSENADDSMQQRLHELSRQREQLQQAEVELRAQFIARAEVMRMQNGIDEQVKQHSEIVASLQGQIQEREQQIRHLEQQLEERERQLRVNQMETNEAVWAKDGLLREQTNELTTLRRERDSAMSEQKTAAAQFDAERAEHMVQLESLKDQVREKDRQLQEAEEQNRATQDILLYKDEQMRDAQAWMARAQELDAYHVNTNNTLHNELRERTEQMNNLWVGYQRQLADVERYHAQMIQRLQQEVTELREQNRVLKGGAAPELSEVKEERPSLADNKEGGGDEHGSKNPGSITSTGNRAKSNGMDSGSIMANGNLEGIMPVLFPRDVPAPKVEHATGIPVVPTPLLGITPVLPPSSPIGAMHQFGMHQQGMPLTLQPTPLPVPQPSLAQLQPLAALLGPQQHLPPLQHQQVIHHHLSQQHQSPQVHRISQRPQQQQPLQQLQPQQQADPITQSQHSQQPSALLSQGQQTLLTQVQPSRHQEHQLQLQHQHQHQQQPQSQPQHQDQAAHEPVGTQGDPQNVPVTQASTLPSQHNAHLQVLQQQQQQVPSQLLHQQQQSQPIMTGSGSEQNEVSPQTQQSRIEEHQGLSSDQQQAEEVLQKPELVSHRQQINQQERQSHEQRRRMDPRLQHFSHPQTKHLQAQNHQHFQHEINRASQPQQHQHQQGISSRIEHLGGGSHSTSLSQEDVTSTSHVQHEVPALKSGSDAQEIQKPNVQTSKQQCYGEQSNKVAEPVLLDERSLLACLVRAVPAEPSARIRISSTLPNRLGKMLAPLHWHDYRKQYGRLDEFVGSHPELFVIDGDFIHLQEGAHATFSATTAVAKAAAAAAAVMPTGPARMPNVAVTPVAQSQLQRVRSLKGSNSSQKDTKATPAPTQDGVGHSSVVTQAGNSRQPQNASMNRNTMANGNMNQHHGSGVNQGSTSSNNGSKADGQHNVVGSGGRTNGSSSNLGSDNPPNSENGSLSGYGSPGRSSYYGSRQARGSFTSSGQYRKQESQMRPQTQEGRIVGSAPALAH